MLICFLLNHCFFVKYDVERGRVLWRARLPRPNASASTAIMKAQPGHPHCEHHHHVRLQQLASTLASSLPSSSSWSSMQAAEPRLWRLNLVTRTVNIVRDSTLHHQYHHSCHRHRLKHHQISSSSSPASLSTASFQSTIYNSLNLRRSSQTKIIHIVMACELYQWWIISMTDSRHSSKDTMESKALSSLKVSPLQLLSTPIFQRIGESKFSTVVKVRRGRFFRLKKVIFRFFLDEINFGQTVGFRFSMSSSES